MSDVQGLTVEEQRVYEEGPTLLAAAQRCNRYVASDYTPVYVEDVKVRRIGQGAEVRMVFLFCGGYIIPDSKVHGESGVGVNQCFSGRSMGMSVDAENVQGAESQPTCREKEGSDLPKADAVMAG